ITGNGASEYIVDGQTLAAGKPPITVAGQVLSVASSGSAMVFGPSTQAIVAPPLVLSTSLPLLTFGGSTIAPNAASEYVVAGQTIRPGGSAVTVDGTVISLESSAAAAVIGGSTQLLAPSPVLATTVAPLITLGPQVLSANADSDYVIGGQTLKAGGAITVSGSVISLAPGASEVVIDGSTKPLAPQTVSLSIGMPALTIGSATISADVKGEYVLSGQTIRPGTHAATIDGQMVSLAANNSLLVVGSSTQTLNGFTKTSGAITRSSTRNAGAASSTAMATSFETSAPTLGGPPATATSDESGGAVAKASVWLSVCVVTITMILGVYLV
ncbi:MAG: hypothetical protein Q9183_007554, partial [Haloplaca sp. 2 TL-2023]